MSENTEINYPERLSLAGRGVVVLGTGAGIGGQVARAIAGAGGRVLAVDLNAEAAEEAAAAVGGIGMAADVTDRDQVAAVFDRAEAEFGDDFYGIVDVVGATVPEMLADSSAESYDRQFDLVLRHAVYVTQLGLPRLAARGRGSAVFIGSLAGVAQTRRLGLYGAAKAAEHHLAKAAAAEFGPHGVRVNGIVTGRILASGGDPNPDTSILETVNRAIPLRRTGFPDDIASATLFLLSDLAGYVTGVELPVDGGISMVTPLPSTQPANRQ